MIVTDYDLAFCNLANSKSCIKELRFIIGIEYSFLLILYFYMHFVIGCSIYF